MRDRIALVLAFAGLIALGLYFSNRDPFCEPIRIARVIELGGCR